MSSRLRIVPLNENPRKRKKKPARARKSAKRSPPDRKRKSPRRVRAGASKKSTPLFGFTDANGEFHPIRNSPGYLARLTSNPARSRSRGGFVIEACNLRAPGFYYWNGKSFARSRRRARRFATKATALAAAKAIHAPADFYFWRPIRAAALT